MSNILLIHNSYYDEDIDNYKIIKILVEIKDYKEIITYQYVMEDNVSNICEKKIEEDVNKEIIDSIINMDLSSLKDKYETKEELESWEVDINNKKIIGTYDQLPKEIFEIMKNLKFFDIINGGLDL